VSREFFPWLHRKSCPVLVWGNGASTYQRDADNSSVSYERDVRNHPQLCSVSVLSPGSYYMVMWSTSTTYAPTSLIDGGARRRLVHVGRRWCNAWWSASYAHGAKKAGKLLAWDWIREGQRWSFLGKSCVGGRSQVGSPVLFNHTAQFLLQAFRLKSALSLRTRRAGQWRFVSCSILMRHINRGGGQHIPRASTPDYIPYCLNKLKEDLRKITICNRV